MRALLNDRRKCDRQTDDEFAPHSWAFTAGLNTAAVHLNQPLDQRKADAQPTLRLLSVAFHLCIYVEYFRQHVGWDADSRISHFHHGVTALALDRQSDVTAFLRVLCGVVEEVGEDLRQLDRVSVHVD